MNGASSSRLEISALRLYVFVPWLCVVSGNQVGINMGMYDHVGLDRAKWSEAEVSYDSDEVLPYEMLS